jgi:hypothetical protein
MWGPSSIAPSLSRVTVLDCASIHVFGPIPIRSSLWWAVASPTRRKEPTASRADRPVNYSGRPENILLRDSCAIKKSERMRASENFNWYHYRLRGEITGGGGEAHELPLRLTQAIASLASARPSREIGLIATVL